MPDNVRFPASAFRRYGDPEEEANLEGVPSEGDSDVPYAPPYEAAVPVAVPTPAYTPATDTYGWAYAPPGHLPGQPAVPIPDRPPGAEIAPNRPVHLPSGVVAYRQTYAEHDRLAELDRQREQARRAAEQAAMDAKMFAQMSRVATSMKDIEIARRDIEVLRATRRIQAGEDPRKVFMETPGMFRSGTEYASALRAVTPAPVVPAPSVVNLPGMPPAVRSGRYGERVQFAPAPTLEAPKSVMAGDTEMVQVAPNRFQQVRKPPEGKLTDQQRARLSDLRKQRDIIATEMTSTQWDLKVRAGGSNQDYVDRTLAKRKELEAEIAKIEGIPVPEPEIKKPVAVLGQGTKADPAKPETSEQFKSLPSGAWFINPKDGKLMQKK